VAVTAPDVTMQHATALPTLPPLRASARSSRNQACSSPALTNQALPADDLLMCSSQGGLLPWTWLSPPPTGWIPPPEATTAAGAAAQAYERHKRAYLGTADDCEAQGIQFRPIVGEPSGGWGPSALCTLKAIAKAQVSGSHDGDAGAILSAELQHLCTAVRRANARAVLSRSSGPHALPPPAVADATAILGVPPVA
jgi:hypothetical protein